MAVEQAAGWDRRVHVRGKILPWLSAAVGFQELERRWRLQLDLQVKEWTVRGIGKVRQREDKNRYYYLRAAREFGRSQVFLELGRYDRGRLDAYWVPEKTVNLGWEISFEGVHTLEGVMGMLYLGASRKGDYQHRRGDSPGAARSG